MRSPRWLALSILLFVAASTAFGAPGDDLHVVASDAHGVTLRLDVPDFEIGVPDAAGRSRVTCPGLDTFGEPGRPSLPSASTLLALPPGARAVARVTDLGAEDVRNGVKLVPLGRSVMRDDGGALGIVPAIETVPAIADGPWPRGEVVVGAPYTVRRQRLVAVRVRPFRYDEATGTLSRRRSITVRIDFVGGSAAPTATASAEDRHWDAVLEGAVSNLDLGKRWRAEAPRTDADPVTVLRRGRGTTLDSRAPFATPEARAAFDEDNVEVRVRIDTTGVHAITFDNLATHGYPAGIAIDQVSVHRHEYVAGASPPYVTIELPIEVDDRNTNGVFDSGDRIVLWVQNWAERSRASIAQRAWGDGEVVYATSVVGHTGLRLGQRSGWLNQTLTPLATYRHRQHFEISQFYLTTFNPGIPGFTPFESDTNTDQFIWTGLGFYDRSDPSFPDNFPFETNDLDTSRSVRVTIQWQGLKQNTHNNWAEVRNGSGVYTHVVDSLVWTGRKTVTRTASLFGSALSNGRTNTLRLWGTTIGGPTAIVNAGLNWFEIDYARSFKGVRGYLACTSDSATGDFQIQAVGFFTSALRVYDVTDSLNPVRLSIDPSRITQTGSTFQVDFQDTSPTSALRRYVVFDTPKALPPDRYATVTRRNLYARATGDYLLVTPEALLAPAQTLANFRQSQGLDVVMSPLESVDDEFNGGRKSTYAIRRYAQYAFNRWNASFLLLFGDASEDPLNSTGTAGPDWVPTQRIGGPIGITDGSTTVYESVPSDPWMVWCLNCPSLAGQPMLHDLFIGRLPVKTLAEANAVVAKVVAYETVTPDQTWRKKMLICADDQYSTQSFFGGDPGGPRYCFKDYEQAFIEISNILKSVVLDEAYLKTSDVEIFDLAVYLANEPTTPDPSYGLCRDSWSDTQLRCHSGVTPQLMQKINDGVLWWNFQGHANQYVLTHEDLYKNISFDDDIGLFANDGKPFLFTAFSCHPNGFAVVFEKDPQRGPCIGEEIVDLPSKGAIAAWASCGYELLPTDYSHHLNVWLARALFSRPPRDPLLSDRGARVVLGEAIESALVANYDSSSGQDRHSGITYHLLGDPATRLSIGPPQALVTANRLAVDDDQPVRLHTVGDTLRLDADLVSNVQIKTLALDREVAGVTTTVPPAQYTLTPPFPDSASGGRRYHLTYRTSLSTATERMTLRTTDLYGVNGTFRALFPFQTVLRADGSPVGEGEPVQPTAVLTLTVLSPAPLTVPAQLTVTLNAVPVTYTFQPANGDTSGREWTLGLPHSPFSAGDYLVQVTAAGGGTSAHTFVVEQGGDQVSIKNAYAFPNPFDEQVGTYFSFRLASPTPADVQIRVFTIAGKLVYTRTEHGLAPGYKQLPWDGLDAEGQPLSNGVYVYKLLARNGTTSDMYQGRLVKLRKPHHEEDTSTSTP